MPGRNVRAALEALFDEGVNFADYDEGKMNTTQPDGYEHRGVDVVEIRRRAVERAFQAAPVVFGVWRTYWCGEDDSVETDELVSLHWTAEAAAAEAAKLGREGSVEEHKIS